MPAAPKAKSASPNAASKKTKPVTTNGAVDSGSSAASVATPSTQIDIDQASLLEYGPGKPDRAVFDNEQAKVKADIDAVQLKLSAVKDKIGLSSKNGSGNDRRTQLRNELESIRSQQSENKYSRGKVLDQLKQLQDGIQKKIKDLNATKAKAKFKTVEDVDDRISALQRQVDSATMKVADEKRALQEITQTRRLRKTIENFKSEQDSIDHDRQAEEELRKLLEDPEAKAISERYDRIKAELDDIKKDSDEAYANRSKLIDERNSLQAELDVLYGLKRESSHRFKEANDKHWAKMNEDRARRAEKARTQRAAEEEIKKKELVARLREEASEPAYQLQIEDCRTLIEYFSGGAQSPTPTTSTPLSDKADVAGVPKLDIRQVEASSTDGLVVRKKKGDDQESYFVGAKGKKSKKSVGKTNGSSETAASAASQLNIPLPTLAALLTLSIPPPSSTAEMPRVVEDLKTKMAWFEANQERVTKERIAKTETEIKRLTSGSKTDAKIEEAGPGVGGVSSESAPVTPQDKGLPSIVASNDQVMDESEHERELVAA